VRFLRAKALGRRNPGDDATRASARAGECGARSPPASSSSIAQATFFVYEQI
jgi:hypothetical protein